MRKGKILLLLIPLLIFACALLVSYRAKPVKDQSVEKSLRWLTGNKDLVSIEISTSAFEKIRKISGKDFLKPSSINVAAVPITDSDFENMDSLGSLLNIVDRIITNKCLGGNYKSDVEKITKILARSKGTIFDTGSRASAVTAVYELSEIGVYLPEIYDKVLNQIRDDKSFSEANVYAVTHIIFTKSDYYSNYLNPEEFSWARERLHKMLNAYIEKGALNDIELDAASEILISLKLLKESETADMANFSKILIQLQNPDGSWSNSSSTENKFHHTYISTIALMKFPDKFTEGDVFCPTSLIK